MSITGRIFSELYFDKADFVFEKLNKVRMNGCIEVNEWMDERGNEWMNEIFAMLSTL